MPSATSRSVASCLAAAGLLFAGCQSIKREYPGLDDDSVWTALVASARSPDYEAGVAADRWTVRENRILEDSDGRRIEVYRRLARVVRQPAAEPRREERTWRFRITLDTDEPRMPVARFVNRGLAVPVQVRSEADRYFRGVTDLLSAPPPSPGSGLLPFLPDHEQDDEPVLLPAEVEIVHPEAVTPAPADVFEPTPGEPDVEEVDPALLDILDPG